MKLLLLWIFASVSIFASQNSWNPPPKNPVIPIGETIEILNEDLTCSADSDCRVFDFGHKACGGPASYIIASTANQHFAEIQDLAELSRILEARYNRDNSIISNCMAVMPPNVECSENKCVRGAVGYPF